MWKRFVIMLLTAGVMMTASIYASSTEGKPERHQYGDLYWQIEDDYAVIVGNIYDSNGNSPASDASTVLVIPSEIEGYPVKVLRGGFGIYTRFTKVVLPEGLETIEGNVFSESPIMQLDIPSTVTSIDPGIVMWCGSLEWIEVAPDNPNYTSIDGMLYTKDGKELICCPTNLKCESGTLFIPEGTERVCQRAFTSFSFYGASHATKILVFPEGLTTLEDQALFEAFFKAIYFPSTLEHIGEEALGISGDDIYFAGEKPATLDEHAFTLRSGDIRLHYGVAYPAGEDSTPQEIVEVPMEGGASPSLSPFPPSTPTPTSAPTARPTPKPTQTPAPAPTPMPSPAPSPSPTAAPAVSDPPGEAQTDPAPVQGPMALLLLGGGGLLFAAGFLLGRKKHTGKDN